MGTEGIQDPVAALADLRSRLEAGRVAQRLNKTELAHRALLGRTVVSQALSPSAPAPSAQTVGALAKALRLRGELPLLLALLATATGALVGAGEGLGKPIAEWDPHDLEVHPAAQAPARSRDSVPEGVGRSRSALLPGYVRRPHDEELAALVAAAQAGRSQMAVLVGSSSTGKTRACWEAVQPLAEHGWRLWHPFDPTRAPAALADLHRVQPCTVVWLNEAQHYLGDPRVGEQVSAAVHSLLLDPDGGPVLVLGTLWPEYADQYMALPATGGADPHSRVRELLAGRTLSVPETFDPSALRAAATLAGGGDRLLADALARASADGRVTQDLAGGPELLRRYEQGSPVVRAVLQAAMDARRLGVGPYLLPGFLTDAAIDYLSDQDLDELTEDWVESAFADLARPVHGKQAPLRRAGGRPRRCPPGTPTAATASVPVAGPAFRLADYLEQHGRNTRRAQCPPASFWHAAHTHLTDADGLNNLAEAAERRLRLQWGHHLRQRAASAGSAEALIVLAEKRERAGDLDGAEALARQAADAGDSFALVNLARLRERAGDLDGAEELLRKAVDAGGTHALVSLARLRERAGDRGGAEALARQAADSGNARVFLSSWWRYGLDADGTPTHPWK